MHNLDVDDQQMNEDLIREMGSQNSDADHEEDENDDNS